MRLNFISVYRVRKGYLLKTDEELISDFLLTKDAEIISQLFDRYVHLVYASCANYLRNHETAKDATMEIFEVLGEKIMRYEIRNFKSWLYKVIRNYCLALLRKKKYEESYETLDFIQFKYVENEIGEHLSDDEDKKSLQLIAGLQKLKDGQKLCLELMYLHHKSYKEITLETGYTEKQVKSYIQNGKRNLKKLFNNPNEKNQ